MSSPKPVDWNKFGLVAKNMMAAYGYYNQLQINFTENSGFPFQMLILPSRFVNNSMFINQGLLLVKRALME